MFIQSCLCCAGLVPSSWGQAGAYQNLMLLSLADNQLTGLLPGSWPLRLQWLTLSNNRLRGTVLAGLSAMKQLQILEVDHNSLTGQLPVDWGLVDVWPQLFLLDCSANSISGTLPSSWGNHSAFQTLLFCTLMIMTSQAHCHRAGASVVPFLSLKTCCWGTQASAVPCLLAGQLLVPL